MADISEEKRGHPDFQLELSAEDSKPPRTLRKKPRRKEDDRDIGKSEKRSKKQVEDSIGSKTENEEEEVIKMPSSSKRLKKGKPTLDVLESAYTRGLAQSRKWDQEELEVIVPEEELSAESDVEGENQTGSVLLWDLDHLGSLNDDEKAKVDWLTRVLPDEMLRKVYRYLNPRDVDATAKVCHRTNNLANERSVWEIFRPEWVHVTKERFNKAERRNGYSGCYNYEMKKREDARIFNAEIQHENFLIRQSEWAKSILSILLFNRSVDYLSILCLILGSCFAAARCQETILWNWRLVLLPFYIPILQLILTPIAYDLCRYRFSLFIFDRVVSRKSLSAWHFFVVTRRSNREILSFTGFAFIIFFILLMIKLNDTYDGIPAGPLIIPWLLLLIAVDLDMIFGWASGVPFSDGCRVDRLFVLLSSIFLAVSMFLIVFKLDNVLTWRWTIVLIPVWAYWGFCIAYPGLALCFSIFSASIHSNNFFVRSRGGGDAAFFYVLIFVIVLGLIFTWALLSSLNLDGSHRSWPVIFIPIFICEGIMLFGCAVIDVIGFLNNG